MAHQHQHQHQHSADEDTAALAELLELDAVVLRDYQAEVADWVLRHATPPPARIVDLGAGTGTGTMALARLATGAELVAVDQSAEFLGRLAATARAHGLADRVRTVAADLDAGWPDLGPVDLVWASLSLHHLGDADRLLRQVHDALVPGGLLAVAEMRAFPRFLPDDVGLGRPGLEERCHEARAGEAGQGLPDLGSDWPARLAGAGFTVVAERRFAIELVAPHPAGTGRYAQIFLQRIRSRLDGRLPADDLTTLDTLVDDDGPHGVRQRPDLVVRTAREVWLARPA